MDDHTIAQPQPQFEISTRCHLDQFLRDKEPSSPSRLFLEVDFFLENRRPVFPEFRDEDSMLVYEACGSSTAPTVEISLDYDDYHNPNVVNALSSLGLEGIYQEQVLQAVMNEVERIFSFCNVDDDLSKGSVGVRVAADICRTSNVFANGRLVGQDDYDFNKECLEMAIRGLVRANEGEILDDQNCCSICLDELFGSDKVREEEDGAVVKLPNCKHVFHVSCITKWLMKTRSCPLCRESCLPKA